MLQCVLQSAGKVRDVDAGLASDTRWQIRPQSRHVDDRGSKLCAVFCEARSVHQLLPNSFPRDTVYIDVTQCSHKRPHYIPIIDAIPPDTYAMGRRGGCGLASN
jgi:hypothetical protein